MAINMNGIGGNSGLGGINYNSAQYKAAARDSLSSIMAEELTMTPEERYMYELFGDRERIMKNKMQMYDKDGNMLNAHGVAGMCMTGVSLSEAHQIIDVPASWRQAMFDETKRHFIQENGVANGDTTKRSQIFEGYQRSTSIENRLKGTWTLGQYEKQYRTAFANAVKAANPDWELGDPFDANILNNITRESIDSSLSKASGEYGAVFVSNRIDLDI